MHIGINANTLPTTVFINRLIVGLLNRGHNVTVFGTQLKAYNRVKGANYASFNLYSRFNLSKKLCFFKYSFLLLLLRKSDKKKFDNLLRQKGEFNRHNQTRFYPILWHKPEVLHVQWVKGIEQYLWVQQFGIKLMASLRGTHIYMNPLLDKAVADGYTYAFPKLDGVHAVCKDLLLEAEQYGLKGNKSTVIYSGLMLDEFVFKSHMQGEQSNKLKLISIGRQSWMKGYHYALDALKMIKNMGIDFNYTILGGGASEELIFQVADLVLENEVKLMGWLPFEKVKKETQDADILIVSSVSEGIANTAIEAMALGTVVISSNCGGMAELIEDGVNGFLVANRNTNEIAAAIKKYVDMPDEAKKAMIDHARKTIEQKFSAAEMISSFEVFYQQGGTSE